MDIPSMPAKMRLLEQGIAVHENTSRAIPDRSLFKTWTFTMLNYSCARARRALNVSALVLWAVPQASAWSAVASS
eukprot:923204-Pelagomonas_calceolata.AAC.2